ncbi:hypothetical protein LOD99_9441 [Oopsacas minuta]|uniref:Adenylate kinase n=1 Tax=Oopsacas minuta TaxID=111878 RepID=A0AAV7JBQ5_9METZ|nr:hypothetical protein LOD99_9441 [Oopsacas minuta]
MGCASSSNTNTNSGEPSAKDLEALKKRQLTEVCIPHQYDDVVVEIGLNCRFKAKGPTVIFLFGGPGSHKGKAVEHFTTIMRFKYVNVETIIMEEIPKRSGLKEGEWTMSDLIAHYKRTPQDLKLEHLLRYTEDKIVSITEDDPNAVVVVDILPSLKFILSNNFMLETCKKDMDSFEFRVKVAFGINLHIEMESLLKNLDFSHNMLMQGGDSQNKGVGADEVDTRKAERRYQMHEDSVRPFREYFEEDGRMMTVDCSSGFFEAIWHAIQSTFVKQFNSRCFWPMETVLVFAMEGLDIFNSKMDMSTMRLVKIRDLVSEPQGNVEKQIKEIAKYVDSQVERCHYFILDPADTTFGKGNPDDLSSYSEAKDLVFYEKTEGLNNFTVHLNALVKDTNPSKKYFKAVCSLEDESLVFPANSDTEFTHRVCLCLSDKQAHLHEQFQH